MKKKRFFANHSKSSALVVSVAIHAVLIVVAISFVAVKAIPDNQKLIGQMKINPNQVTLEGPVFGAVK